MVGFTNITSQDYPSTQQLVKSVERLMQYLPANYTITATNAGGSDSTTISIEVNDVVPYN